MKNAADLARHQRAVATAFTEVFMEEILGEAQRIVPHEEGTLSGTADRETMAEGSQVVVIGYFATPYARYQHENTQLKHKNGRQAKYLETPFKQKLNAYPIGLARALKATI